MKQNFEKKNILKNSIYRVEITDMNGLGVGVGRIDEIVIFVQGGCTGDVADVRVIKIAKNYLVGRIETLITPSPYRLTKADDCPVASRCGGCVWRNIRYEHELTLKRRFVEGAMLQAGVSVKVADVLHTGVTDGYRNKAQYPVGRGRDGKPIIGFYAEKTHEIIPLQDMCACRLQPPVFGEICEVIRAFLLQYRIEPYDELTGRGMIRYIYLRRSESTGEVMVCIVNTARCRYMPELAKALREKFTVSVWENINSKPTNVVLGREYFHIAGNTHLTDCLCGREFAISPESFWQVNRAAAEMLYRKAGELAAVKPHERVLDLFCGIGSVGMSVCERDTRLVGVEIVEAAVRNARDNAVRNRFDNAGFICCDASDSDAIGHEIGRIADGGLDVVLLDPPRKGCSLELLQLLVNRTSARIVYISCNPETLARDLRILSDAGMVIGTVTPVDLFPRTAHVENIVLLTRK